MRRLAAALALLLAATPALARGPVLVTVTGAITETNRGPFDPATDRLFALNAAHFDKAYAFDFDALADLPQQTLRVEYPRGGPDAKFRGPLLADVLAAAGATGAVVAVRALDGYGIEEPAEELFRRGAILAIRRDGDPMGIGDFGPAQLVFPRPGPDGAETEDEWWIWQVYHIEVK